MKMKKTGNKNNCKMPHVPYLCIDLCKESLAMRMVKKERKKPGSIFYGTKKKKGEKKIRRKRTIQQVSIALPFPFDGNGLPRRGDELIMSLVRTWTP